MYVIEGDTFVNLAKIAIVISRVNRFINKNLLEGALDVLTRIGHIEDDNITVIWVPGAYELPLAAQVVAVSNKYNALVVLGTIVKGMTAHFDVIFRLCSSELIKIAINNKLPVGLGVLVADDINQAIERAGIKNTNKGSEAALAALEMINVLRMVDK